jgi:hypothetical protein
MKARRCVCENSLPHRELEPLAFWRKCSNSPERVCEDLDQGNINVIMTLIPRPSTGHDHLLWSRSEVSEVDRGQNTEPQTLNPKSQTLNKKIQTPNPKPQTPDIKL